MKDDNSIIHASVSKESLLLSFALCSDNKLSNLNDSRNDDDKQKQISGSFGSGDQSWKANGSFSLDEKPSQSNASQQTTDQQVRKSYILTINTIQIHLNSLILHEKQFPYIMSKYFVP